LISPTGTAVRFFIAGPPVAQPRTKSTLRKGKKDALGNQPVFSGVYTPGTADGWKTQVAVAVLDRPRFPSPYFLRLEFVFERPASHFGTKGNLLPGAPEFHEVKPDPDNLGKSTMDAMVDAGFLSDDRKVCGFFVTKEWGERAGCRVTISSPKSHKEA